MLIGLRGERVKIGGFMESEEDATSVLAEEIEEEVLERMPEWFRVLRDEYEKKSKL